MTTFVALGDSITVGIGDPAPDGGWRGWAALLAATMPQSDMHNLATLGAQARDVERRQLRAAVTLEPDVASVVVGINDTLRAASTPSAPARRLTAPWPRCGRPERRCSPCGCPTQGRCSACPGCWPGRWPAGCAR